MLKAYRPELKDGCYFTNELRVQLHEVSVCFAENSMPEHETTTVKAGFSIAYALNENGW